MRSERVALKVDFPWVRAQCPVVHLGTVFDDDLGELADVVNVLQIVSKVSADLQYAPRLGNRSRHPAQTLTGQLWSKATQCYRRARAGRGRIQCT
jgi:hypothetical protein